MTEDTLLVQDFVGIDELEELAKAEPDNVDIQRRWAWSLLRTNHAQKAKEVLDKASQQAPNDPELWYAKGVVLLRVNEDQEAKSAFQKVTELLQDRAVESPRLTMMNHMAKTHIKKLGS
jgi:Flp pilus assembly protein TadD